MEYFVDSDEEYDADDGNSYVTTENENAPGPHSRPQVDPVTSEETRFEPRSVPVKPKEVDSKRRQVYVQPWDDDDDSTIEEEGRASFKGEANRTARKKTGGESKNVHNDNGQSFQANKVGVARYTRQQIVDLMDVPRRTRTSEQPTHQIVGSRDIPRRDVPLPARTTEPPTHQSVASRDIRHPPRAPEQQYAVQSVDAREVFIKLVQQCKGKAPPGKVRGTIFPPGYSNNQVIQWFRDRPDQFIVYESDDGIVSGLSVCVRNARLCFNYNSGVGRNARSGQRGRGGGGGGRAGYVEGGCTLQNCPDLHVCSFFVMGYCTYGENCKKRHNFRDEKIRNVLTHFGIVEFDATDLLVILQMSTLQVCSRYNQSTCTRASSCHHLHMCRGAVNNQCQLERGECRFEHDFESLHSQRLLRLFGLDQEPNREVVKKSIQFSRLHMRNQSQWDRRSRSQHRFPASELRVFDADVPQRGRSGSFSSAGRNAETNQNQRIAATAERFHSLMQLEPDAEKSMRKPESEPVQTRVVPPKPVQTRTAPPKPDVIPKQSYIHDTTLDSDNDDFNWHVEKAQKVGQFSSPPPKPNEDLIHVGNDIAICLQHVCSLAGDRKCPNGRQCFDHHVNMMYMWQVKVFEGWESLTLENEHIETAYCNPNKSAVKVKVATNIIGLHSQTLRITFGNEERMHAVAADTPFDIRRLSTKSGRRKEDPTTKWYWYYSGVVAEAKDCNLFEHGDQIKLENAYQDGKTNLQLIHDYGQYTIFLGDSWCQMNTRTRTKRIICRRPQSYLSREEVLKKQWGEIAEPAQEDVKVSGKKLANSIVSAQASVLIYDEANKKWLPPSGTSQGRSKVHIYHHSVNNTFHVVGSKLQGHELVINCAMFKGLKYTQASSTFHYWQDRGDGRQVYGLNFISKEEADKFAQAMLTALGELDAKASIMQPGIVRSKMPVMPVDLGASSKYSMSASAPPKATYPVHQLFQRKMKQPEESVGRNKYEEQ